MHHPVEPGAPDDAPDSTALAVFAASQGFVGDVVFVQEEGIMALEERVEREVRVKTELCAVTARKVRGRWRASGELRGKVIEVLRAETPDQAFEWWHNKASIEPLIG